MYKGNLIRLSADFSEETSKTGKEWCDTFKVLQEKQTKQQTHFQPRILYIARLSFRTEVEIKSCLAKQKLKEIIINKIIL